MLLLIIATILYAKTTTKTATYSGSDEEGKTIICQKAKLQAQLKVAEALGGVNLSSDITVSKGALLKDEQIAQINNLVKVLSSRENFRYPKCTVTITAKVSKGKPITRKRPKLNEKIWEDPDTGLMWQNEPYTAKEDKAEKGNYNYGKVGDWEYAKRYCRDLTYGGYDDWRLPSSNVLKTILTKTKYRNRYGQTYYLKKALADGIGGDVDTFYYWSSTSNADSSSGAWSVYFGFLVYGDAYSFFKDRSYWVRCVR